jgi:hypothetical protein
MQGYFYGKNLYHFTHKCFRTHLGSGTFPWVRLEILLGRVQAILKPGFHPVCFIERCFTYKCFYTGRGLHTEMVLRREMIL